MAKFKRRDGNPANKHNWKLVCTHSAASAHPSTRSPRSSNRGNTPPTITGRAHTSFDPTTTPSTDGSSISTFSQQPADSVTRGVPLRHHAPSDVVDR